MPNVLLQNYTKTHFPSYTTYLQIAKIFQVKLAVRIIIAEFFLKKFKSYSEKENRFINLSLSLSLFKSFSIFAAGY